MPPASRVKLVELVDARAVVAELESQERGSAIRELVRGLAESGAVAADQVENIVKLVLTRERRGTTGIGKGVAVPHAKVPGLSRVAVAVGRSSRGIDFSSLDGEPVFAIFLIVSPEERPEEHLRAVDLIFSHLTQERFRKFLRQASSAAKIYELLKEADEKTLVA